MNFFEQQAKAKDKTVLLILMFMLAIIVFVVIVDLIYLAVVIPKEQGQSIFQLLLHNPELIVYRPEFVHVYYISFSIMAVILFGSLVKYLIVVFNVASIAKTINARLITRDSQDLNEQKLINIVEEMSIASGVPSPKLYIMDDESSMNAFVAGHNPKKVILVVTRGIVEKLTRDELQGVIAHEYSHIFNGDMNLNLKIIAVLAGLLLLSRIGFQMLRVSGRGGKKGKNKFALLGLAFIALGLVGTFLGYLVKAAVSRQREFLADASAVQFTRNPKGIATALLKIRDQGKDAARLQHINADRVSHMCFVKALRSSFFNPFASHPPIASRIKAIDVDGSIEDEYLQATKL